MWTSALLMNINKALLCAEEQHDAVLAWSLCFFLGI